MVGVGIAGRPVSRHLDDGTTIEITRCCIREEPKAPNAASMIYSRLARAAKALGYRKVVTYTLERETGTSLMASGFRPDGETLPQSWDRPSRHRYDFDLFGTPRQPQCAKTRWMRDL